MTLRDVAAWGVVAILVGACGSSPIATSPPATRAETSSPATSTSTPVSPTAAGSESASASAAASAVTFTSPLYGYTVSLPAGWSATPAITVWDGEGAPGNDDPAVDKFQSGGSAAAFAFAAPVSLDLAAYAADVIARNDKFHGDLCPTKPDLVEATTVGSDPATFIAWNCGILINVVVALHGDKGYEFVFRDPGVNQATNPADQETFDSMLETVSFPA
jgi:hypothetical protein